MSERPRNSDLLASRVRWQAIEVTAGAAAVMLDEYEQHLTYAAVAQLTALAGHADLHLHRNAIPQLQAAWREVESEGLLDRVQALGDVYAARLSRTQPNTLSAHALGLAPRPEPVEGFDLNPEQHPLGPSTSSGQGRCLAWDYPGGVRPSSGSGQAPPVPIFERWGFRWGGYPSTSSGQAQPSNGSHFEVVRFLAPGETRPTRVHLLVDGKLACHLPALRGGTWPEGQQLGGDPPLGDAIWVGAAALAPLLGGSAVEPTERIPGPHRVAVTVGGQTTTLTGQRAIGGVVVPLDDLLPLFGRRAVVRPGKGRVEVVAA